MKKESTSKVKKMRLHLRGVNPGAGFTLVEILVTMAIVAIVGTILVTIFTNTLRGSNKAQILAVIKQNGQAVLENMDKTIRDADNVACLSADGNTLVVVQNGLYTRYRFIPSTPTANGFIQQDSPVQPASGSNSDIKFFKNNVCTDPMGTDASVINTLTDTNIQTGVSVECPASDCSTNPPAIFTRDPSFGYKDQVTVKFNLKPGISAPAII